MKTMCPSGYHNAFVEIYALGHMMCVCVYTLSPAGFFWLQDVCDILEMFGSTIFCWEYC